MADDDLGELNLLEWSQDLNRALLRLPFRPLRSSIDEQACFLYKLAFASSRKEVGLLLLDCDACAVFYEGVSLRTLDRRTQLHQTHTKAESRFDDAAHLAHITTAIHHALDPCTASDTSLKTTIGLESTRFSSSLSISIKSKDDAIDRNFKTSFDLDPLDHASLSNMISTHFIRPLLHLAHVFARSASQQQLDSIAQQQASFAATSSDSLELLRRSALVNARLPLEPLYPLPARGHDGGGPISLATTTETFPAQPSTATNGLDDDDDSDAEMDFFGPPGVKPPLREPAVHVSSHSKAGQQQTLSSPSPTPSADSEDGDRTLTAPLASTTEADAANFAQGSPSSLARTNGPIHSAQEENDSDTSEEESLPLAPTPPSFKDDAHVKQPPSFPLPAESNADAKRSKPRASPAFGKTDRLYKTPESTPPPPSFVPSLSQISPSSSNLARHEQQRRRQQIASIKRGSMRDSANASAKTAAPTRKRSRF
ncbi:uncharacterized protein SPSC_05001 [Sporisorium scitamineum]|uniref:Uncharacterized protein n=1 Tax=Sporisorium scitamineum TaxID=49012 RepID=A0A0F7RWX8_9BASI|nr:hypothetical protein [Sporisorium scitamineum]CDU25167.1 uncharacterized protein SPSC_05001 [Sporisorium scitamineum]